MYPVAGLPRLARWLLHPIAKGSNPMLLHISTVAQNFLLRLLLICKSNGLPTVLTVGQDISHDADDRGCTGEFPSRNKKNSLFVSRMQKKKKEKKGELAKPEEKKG
jgi:hypothetical protein